MGEQTEDILAGDESREFGAKPPDPFESVTDTAPWVPASFDGECSSCDGAIWVGEEIRADGFGGWEGKCCG
jgi:hypothetical protein